MRYPKEHKSQTRDRILRSAAPLLRKRGIGGVSVDSLMGAAKLTRGGFYAHFPSKEALVTAILEQDGGLVRMLEERDGASRAELNRQAARILGDYLDPENRGEVVEGCPLASLPVDAARSSKKIRAAYGRRLSEFIAQLERGLGRTRRAESDAIAVAVLAIGGVLLSRACDSDEDADRLEAACRKHIARLLA